MSAMRRQSQRIPVVQPQTGLATVRDACAFLRVSKKTLYDLMNRNELKSFKHGGRRKFHWSVLREYADGFLN